MVSYRDAEALIRELEDAGPSRQRLRRLQRYTVTIPPRVHAELVRVGDIQEVSAGGKPTGAFVQAAPKLYRDDLGLDVSRAGAAYDPEDLIA